MYIPAYAKHENPELLTEFIESHPFATCITRSEETSEHSSEVYANHFPCLLEVDAKGPRRIVSHMARNNPQWKQMATGAEVLFIFHGPHAYISPSIYVNKLNVPTWSYTAVHAYGHAKIIEDSSAIEEILSKTVSFFESPRAKQWAYDLPQEFRQKLVQAIVGFEVEIKRIEGKFKLNQNRKSEDYNAVVGELTSQGDQNSTELLRYMSLTRTPGEA
jgi:transcriptional regulator